MRRIAATLAVVVALLFSAGSAWADFDDGVEAYVVITLPLCESGYRLPSRVMKKTGLMSYLLIHRSATSGPSESQCVISLLAEKISNGQTLNHNDRRHHHERISLAGQLYSCS